VSLESTVSRDDATVTCRFNQSAIAQENQPWAHEDGL
jgi:hypothetical protein